MIINGQMVVLAREIRGITQDELARGITTSQATVARIEGGNHVDIPDERVAMIGRILDFPVEFFSIAEDLLGFGSSAYFYRKKASLSALDRKRIHGIVNVLRIDIKRMLDSVEVIPNRKLPLLEIDDYAGSASRVAQAVRSYWNLPDGPIMNLTGLIESTGSIIVPCDFGTRFMDATSLRLTEMPPLIFINMDLPGDRWRFTLAHELAHLVMHQVPHEEMELEADEFAAEFLMPAAEMRAFFSRLPKIRLADLANVKPYWKVSIAAMIERARNLKVIDDNARRYLWVGLKRLGYPNEKPTIEKEQARNHDNMLRYFLKDCDYDLDELAAMFRIRRQDLKSWHGVSESGPAARPPLRAVR